MDMTEQLTLNTSGDFCIKTVFYEHIDFSDIFGLVFGCLRRKIRRQESRSSPPKNNAKKQNGCLRRPYK